MKMLRDILNVEEAADFLGFNVYTIREKARLGEIPARKVGREWRFSRRALLHHVEGEASTPELVHALRGAHRTLLAIAEGTPYDLEEALEVAGEVLSKVSAEGRG